jgi:DNA-binding NarL/FixJ family response regulator
MPSSTEISNVRRKAQILIVDDHPVLRRGLTELIDEEPDMVVCAQAESAEEALRLIHAGKPDLAIVDLSLKGTSGIDLIKRLASHHPEVPVLVLSMHEEALFARRALLAGARGYIMKEEAMSDLQAAIRRVLAGKIHLSPSMSESLLEHVAHGSNPRTGSPLAQLSDREMEVFELIGRGLGTREVADKLHRSVKTIETHRANLKRKLGVGSASELVVMAASWVQGH